MSEWYDSQKNQTVTFQKLLQERIVKTNPRRTLTAEESKRIMKLETIAAKLECEEYV